MSEHLTTCPICEVACGLRITVEDGDVVGIRGDAEHPPTRGFICPKGTALQGLHHDPDRLRAPLIRRDGQLAETTWEEAFSFLQERLGPIVAEGGPNAVAWHMGTRPPTTTARGSTDSCPCGWAARSRSTRPRPSTTCR
jgi:anaerobic selenocysteine-containing dehydrogenase